MKRLLAISIFVLGLMVCGCGQTETTKVTGSKQRSSRATNEDRDAGPDLSVPLLDPKPVIWIEDWVETEDTVEDVTEDREKAILLTQMADMMKAKRQYNSATDVYKRALDADATYAYASYQLACNYELNRRHGEARDAFQQAIESGFDDFPTAIADDELGQLREASDFNESLVTIRDRYIKSGPERVGQPIAIRPKSIDRPAAGYPVVIMLHGYGDTNTSYLDEAKAWADSGFVAVALPGSLPLSEGRFVWSMDSFEPTRRDLQAVVQSDSLAPLIDRKHVYLFGFSQGALHALLLTSLDSDQYAGVVAMSPGGPMADRMTQPFLSGSGTAKIVFIHGSQERHAPIAKRYKDKCESSGWPYTSFTHRGGHHFPQDWDKQRKSVIRFLIM